MRYSKSLFCELLLKPELLDKIRTILSGDQTQFAEGVVLNEAVNASRNRSSQIRWIENPELRAVFDPIVADVNRVNDWNLELSHAEHFQHARYAVGGRTWVWRYTFSRSQESTNSFVINWMSPGSRGK